MSFEFLLDHSKFLSHSGRVKGGILLADSGQYSFSRYDLDSIVKVVDKTNPSICYQPGLIIKCCVDMMFVRRH